MRRSASSTRVILLGALAVSVLGWSATAAAEKKRVGVPKFDGPQETVIRKAVMQALAGDGYDVIGGKEIDAAAKATGAELDSNEGFKTVAKELSISAFATGEVGKKKAKLTIRNGADGAVSGEGAFVGATPAKIASDVKDNFLRRLGSAVERGRAPSGAKKPTVAAAPPPSDDDEPSGKSAAPAKAESKADAPSAAKSDSANDAPPAAADPGAADGTVAATAPAPAPEGGEVGPRALDLQVGFRGFSRSLSYNDDYFHNTQYALRDYSLTLGPAIGLHLLVYPGAFLTSGLAAAFGAELNVDYAFGVQSNVKAPTVGTVGTAIHDFNGGVRARLVLGGHELSAFVGGGEHAFVFTTIDAAVLPRSSVDIPDTIYRYVRFGADARLQLAPGFTLTVNAAYRSVFNRGGDQPLQIAYLATSEALRDGYFPYVQIAAIDGSATIGYQITPSIEARFGVDLRRYFMAMNSSNAQYKPDGSGGDLSYPAGVAASANTAAMATPVNKVAGGAIDQYWGITLGAAYIFGGVAPGAASASPDEAEPPKRKHKKKKKGGDEDADEAAGGGDGDKAPAGGGESDE
jgi:hypothetical protein